MPEATSRIRWNAAGLLSKLGVDVTQDSGKRAEGRDFARVPTDTRERGAGILARSGIVPVHSDLLRGIRYANKLRVA